MGMPGPEPEPEPEPDLTRGNKSLFCSSFHGVLGFGGGEKKDPTIPYPTYLPVTIVVNIIVTVGLSQKTRLVSYFFCRGGFFFHTTYYTSRGRVQVEVGGVVGVAFLVACCTWFLLLGHASFDFHTCMRFALRCVCVGLVVACSACLHTY